jgi:hypothetical protein
MKFDGKNNVVLQFIILVLAVTAGQILLKMAVAWLPSAGFLGSIKQVVGAL